MNSNLIKVTFFSIIFIQACISDDFLVQEEQYQQYNNVDIALWPYFESFEKEALNNDLRFDLNALEITGEIEKIPEQGVAGTCQYGLHVSHVTIDEKFWNSASFLEREFVVYHELGHCVLERNHTEASFVNGICKSLMRSGLGVCRDAYNNSNRSYYIEELFSVVGN